MGFGSVIATAMAIIVLLAAGFALAAGITRSADSTGVALKDAADRELGKGNTMLTIDNLTGSMAGGNFTFNLNNIGNEKIANVSQIDVIARITDTGGFAEGATVARWFPYRFPGTTPDCYWEPVNITSIAPGIGDALNPGMLDPGETMLIRVQNATGFPGNDVQVQAAAPNGVSAYYSWVIDN